MAEDTDPLMTGPEAAALCGLAPATWRHYNRLRLVPRPDDPDTASPPNRRTPRWRRSAVEHFRDNRLRGARSSGPNDSGQSGGMTGGPVVPAE